MDELSEARFVAGFAWAFAQKRCRHELCHGQQRTLSLHAAVAVRAGHGFADEFAAALGAALSNPRLRPERSFEQICRLLGSSWAGRRITIIVDETDRDQELRSL